MERHRIRNKPGLFELGERAHWRIWAALAATTGFTGIFIVPFLFAGTPALRSSGATLEALCGLLSLVFAFACLIDYLKPGDDDAATETAHRQATVVSLRARSAGRQVREYLSAFGISWVPAPKKAEERPDKWSLDVLERIEWKRLEDLCCAFYREIGVRAEVTRLGADGGIDVRLFQDETDPTRTTAVVQCKAWNQQVGVKPVRELRGVMTHEKVEQALLMAPRGFTKDARAFAADNRIDLLDGEFFLAILERLPADANRRLLELATEGDWTTPTCPGCGTKMIARDSKRGPFWGCPTYPKCRAMLPMRAPPKKVEAAAHASRR